MASSSTKVVCFLLRARLQVTSRNFKKFKKLEIEHSMLIFRHANFDRLEDNSETIRKFQTAVGNISRIVTNFLRNSDRWKTSGSRQSSSIEIVRNSSVSGVARGRKLVQHWKFQHYNRVTSWTGAEKFFLSREFHCYLDPKRNDRIAAETAAIDA